MRNIEIEVVGERVLVDLDKVPTGTFISMMRLQEDGFGTEAGNILISLIGESVGSEQLNKFSIVSYPFLCQKWLEGVISNVFSPVELGNEIDEIVKRTINGDKND